jgi:SAM-dependent methyltransferase
MVIMTQPNPDLEVRLTALEARYDLLRDFSIRGIWHALDRIYARTAEDAPIRCLACAFDGPAEAFDMLVDTCIFGGGRLERLSCPQCGCVFGPLSMLNAPPEWLAADCKLLYSYYAEGDSTEAEIRCFETLSPTRSGLYLNWGAGAWSNSVEVLRKRGYDVWGYEPNAAEARAFMIGSRPEISARFDGIFTNNVLEHLADPQAQFADFRSVLKPSGVMAHATPCFEWSFAFTRFHVFFPLKDSLHRLARRTGFEVVDAVDDGVYRSRTLRLVDS